VEEVSPTTARKALLYFPLWQRWGEQNNTNNTAAPFTFVMAASSLPDPSKILEVGDLDQYLTSLLIGPGINNNSIIVYVVTGSFLTVSSLLSDR
jgi:hypothetical protein